MRAGIVCPPSPPKPSNLERVLILCFVVGTVAVVSSVNRQAVEIIA
jgi:hypothetical protein